MMILRNKFRTLQKKGFWLCRTGIQCHEPLKGKHKQRGYIHPLGFWHGDGGGAEYTLTLSGSGLLVWGTVTGTVTARSTLRLQDDGTIYELKGQLGSETVNQLSASTDWMDSASRPPGTPSNFDTKYVKGTGDDLDASTTLANNEWGDFGTYANVYYEQRYNGSLGIGKNETDITVHISDDGGASSADTGTYTLTAERLF